MRSSRHGMRICSACTTRPTGSDRRWRVADPRTKEKPPLAPPVDQWPPGMVWDERVKALVPRAEAMLADRLEAPDDLESQLAAYAKNRATLMRFIKQHLVEAEYDDEGKFIPGHLNDFYLVPGAKTKELTKGGARKLGQLYRLAPPTLRPQHS